LWSGYGAIVRYELNGATSASVVVKRIELGRAGEHPRGWNNDLSHQRKLRSYQIETVWYQCWSQMCDDSCRVPRCFGVLQHQDAILIVLEDLDQAGFSLRKSQLSPEALDACLQWLANFHGRFLFRRPEELWPVGTYWHLQTRPDEFAVMAESELKTAAAAIDVALNSAKYFTLVHGDAKVANFCFAPNSNAVAAVDFQYVGGGCGMKDVAYFLGSCLSDAQCERMEQRCLAVYFKGLSEAIERHAALLGQVDFVQLESEWRALYPLAWADFQRFLLGWMPEHKKLTRYSTRMTNLALAALATR